MFSCAEINRGSRDRKLGEETRDVGETSVLGEERQGAERAGGRELRHTGLL